MRAKISARMDLLEFQVKQNMHKTNPDGFREVVNSVAKFWSVLSEEERDYINAVRDMLPEED